jgi:hypothetical protein
MTEKMTRLFAASAVAFLVLPGGATAGTRASTPVVTSSLPAKGNQPPGPKGGFPASPGLEIAKIKASDNAAFKRKSAGT